MDTIELRIYQAVRSININELEKLANDDDYMVRYNVAMNPKCSPELKQAIKLINIIKWISGGSTYYNL